MQTFDTPSSISVDIDVTAGSVHLIADDRGDTTVVVNPSDRTVKADVEAAERTTVDLSNRRLLVKTPKSKGIGSYVGLTRPGSVEVTIELPNLSSFDVTTGFGDVRADGVFGNGNVKSGAGAIHIDRALAVQLNSGAGTLSVNHCQGDARVTTAGNVSIARIDGEAEIKNLNGKTLIGAVGGPMRVRSANGDINVDRAGSDVSAKTASGSIVIGEVVVGEVSLETASGGLELGIKEGSDAWVDARTKFGRVHNTLAAADGPNESRGRVAIRARTSFGDIHIHRSAIATETGET